LEARMFSLGLVLGMGPCFAYCGPILLPFVLASGRGALKGLLMGLSFSVGRAVTYSFLGAGAGVAGMAVIQLLQSEAWLFPIQAGVGLLLLLAGMAIIMGWRPKGRLCIVALRLGGGYGGLFWLGVLTGLSPCVPLAAALALVAANAPGVVMGARAGLAFGLGTAISPLLLLAALLGAGGRWAERSTKVMGVLRLVAGYGLFIYGAHLLISHLLAFVPL